MEPLKHTEGEQSLSTDEAPQGSRYNGIIKYIGVFGGVQGIVSIITLIKVKLVAFLLGPVGVGIVDVFNRTTDLGKKTTDLGIGYSAVRSISEHYGIGRKDDTAYAIKVIRSWSLWLAIIGTLLFFLMAPLLCRWSFGDDATYLQSFRWLSLIVGCASLMGGEVAVLKGTRLLKRMACYQLLCAVAMLFISVPCYYFWGFQGIVPSLVCIAVVLLGIACYYTFPVYPYRIAFFSRQIIHDGLYIIRQGINYTIAGFLNSGAFYFISIYILKNGSEGDVGCYSYGNLLISYVSMLVFASLDADFFARLSGVNKDRQASNLLINRQVEVLMQFIAPLITGFILFLPIILPLFLSNDFAPIIVMAQWAVFSLFFKAMTTPIAYMALSKGESFTFLCQEFFSYLVMVIVMIYGFKYHGLQGLGAGILLSTIFDWVFTLGITTLRYHFRYDRTMWRLFGMQLPLFILIFLICRHLTGVAYWLAGGVCMLSSCLMLLHFMRSKTTILSRFSRSKKK